MRHLNFNFLVIALAGNWGRTLLIVSQLISAVENGRLALENGAL
jgi:hypothetical protein